MNEGIEGEREGDEEMAQTILSTEGSKDRVTLMSRHHEFAAKLA